MASGTEAPGADLADLSVEELIRWAQTRALGTVAAPLFAATMGCALLEIENAALRSENERLKRKLAAAIEAE